MPKRIEFKGQIKCISVSPHGDPEGVVLEDGTFVKIPPHTLLAKEEIEVGASVNGTGEKLEKGPNPTIHHVQLRVGKTLIADDTLDPKRADAMKEKHKKENKAKGETKSVDVEFKGRVVAFGSKPKGEIDRLIFADGTSVHVPKDIELESDDFAVGAEVSVKGEARKFGTLRFVKAESVEAIS